jgi:hypothetical protein
MYLGRVAHNLAASNDSSNTIICSNDDPLTQSRSYFHLELVAPTTRSPFPFGVANPAILISGLVHKSRTLSKPIATSELPL